MGFQGVKGANFYGKTDPGSVRENNEDIFFHDEHRGYCLVADGIGGAAAGELASSLFARTAREVFESEGPIMGHRAAALVQHVFQRANSTIFELAQENPSLHGMGCTAELIVFSENRFVLGHMGDSRTFRLRAGHLKQLTTDHSLVQEQVDQGLITRDEARSHVFGHVIFRAVGIEKSPSLDLLKGKLLPGDVFLLCTDGLTDMVDTALIKAHLSTYAKNHEKVDRLIREAVLQGGRDNITVVIADIS